MKTLRDRLERLSSFRRVFAGAVILASLAAALPAAAQHVVVFVNGEPITALDVEQRIKLEQLGGHKALTRQQALDLLIDDKLKIREGKKWGVEATDSDVENSFNTMASRMRQSGSQLAENLAKAGTSAQTLKARIKAELVWQQLVRGRFQSRLQVDDKDVLSALQAKNINDQDVTTYDYTLRPILFLVPPGASEAAFEARRKEAEALRSNFRDCKEGLPATRRLQDVAVREPVVKNSAEVPPELRKVLDSVAVGGLTPPERTRLGVELYAICAKSVSKADSPSRREARQAMANARFEQESQRYLKELRATALIERR